MNAKAVGLVLVGVLAVAGCGATPGASTVPSAASPSAGTDATMAPSLAASSSPRPSPSPTQTPAPTPDITAMGEAYIEFSDWLRQTSSANDDRRASATDAEAAVLYAEAAALYTEAVGRLSTLELPDSLEADRTRMIAALTTAAAEFVKLSQDLSYDPGTTIADAAEAVGAAGAAIRAALGLPPPPTPKP